MLVIADDPLGLTVQMIAVLAAGMYPVGFLFGVCSDCCACAPCSRCTHLANNGDECPLLGIEYSIQFGEYAAQTLGLSAGDYSNTGIVIPLEDIPALPPLPNTSGEWFSADLSAIVSETPRTSDRCGCESCLYVIGFRAEFTFDNDGFVIYERTLASERSLDKCSEDGSEIQFSATGLWQFIEGGPAGYDLENNAQDVLDWLNSLSLSLSMEIDQCDCGACCDDGCEDDVAEGACQNWAGVGTACDDDPNPCV